MNKNCIFIAGTDTGVGKTSITTFLLSIMNKNGRNATSQKWVQCGELDNPDIQKHGITSPTINHQPYRFKDPVSPHYASKKAHHPIRTETIITATEQLSHDYDCVLIEGSGGIYVPYDENHLMIEWVSHLSLPVILVAANRVGCLNHTLLSLEALANRKITCLGTILNTTEPLPEDIAKNNAETIAQFSGTPLLATIGYKDPNALDQLTETYNIIKNLIR